MRVFAAGALIATLVFCAACQSTDTLKFAGPCAPEMLRLHASF